jgi:hypothetical protein
LTTQPTEKSYFIDLKNSEFDPAVEVCIWSRKLTSTEAEELVHDLIAAAAKAGAPDPLEPAITKMISKAMDYGADAFNRVGARMLRRQMWRIDDRIDLFCWQRVFDNFERHEREERRAEVERAEQRKREQEQRIVDKRKEEVDALRSQMTQGLRRLEDIGWCTDLENYRRQADLVKRVKDADDETLLELSQEV